jgi:imidazolonepropionase-like amidohydrolase
MHVHFGRGGGLPNSPESVERVLRQYLYYGVTTVLNLGAYYGRADQILELRRRRVAGEILAPHIYATGGLLTVPGSHPVDHFPVPEGADRDTYDWSQRGVWVVRTAEDVRDVVARMAESGMDGIKIVVESDNLAREEIPQMPPELVAAAVEAASRYGLPVFVHATSLDELEVAVEAGVDAVVHLVWQPEAPDRELLMEMRRREIAYVPTLSAFIWTDIWGDPADNLTDPFLRQGVEPLLIRTLLESPMNPTDPVTDDDRAFRRRVLAALKSAHDAGIELVGGSDPPGGFTFHGYSMHHELALMVEAGLTPAEALAIATRNAAGLVGAAGDFGTVEPGQRADLLLLSANPLEDIMNTRAIEQVFLDGQMIDREALLP